MKKAKPWTNEFLCNLDKIKGLDVGSTYLNRKSGMSFGHSTAGVILKELFDNFLESRFFIIMFDEATDVNHREQVILYARYSIK